MTDVFAAMVAGGGLLFACVAGAVIAVAVVSGRRERERRQQLEAAAFQIGWRPVTGPVPPVVETAMRSRRNQMAMTVEQSGRPLWMVWHRWTESSGDSSQRVDLTRYYAWLGPSYPYLEIRRRSRLGGRLMPVRGAGTGDPEFDRAYLIRSNGDPQIGRLLGPRLRQELMERRLPPWQINGGVLVVAYDDAPSASSLQPRAAILLRIADLLG